MNRRFLCAIAVAALSLAACGAGDAGGSGGSSTAAGAASATSAGSGDGATSAVPAGLESFYGQKVTWTACDSYQCANVKVPLDYENPTASTVSISMLKVKATGARKGTLFVNPGGPGSSGIELARNASTRISADVRAAYDVVGFDPRGVGSSTAIDCLPDSELGSVLDADFDLTTPQGTAAEEAEAKKIAAGCEASSGELLDHVGTENAARDLDILRVALGENKLNYLGYSYGTELGGQYAQDFPANVGKMVLDGAVDTSLTTARMSYDQTLGFEKAFAHYAQYCINQGSCPLGATVAEVQTATRALLDEALTAKTPTDKTGRYVTRSMLTTAIIGMLYDDATWPYITVALHNLQQGSGEAVRILADLVNARDGNTFTDNSTEANWAITCADLGAGDEAEYARYARELETKAPVFGAMQTEGSDLCSYWPSEAQGDGIGPFVAEGSAPILVVGTTSDPATPYAWAEAMARRFDDAVLLTYDGDGHTAYGRSSACINSAVDSYLLDGTLPKEGTVCTTN